MVCDTDFYFCASGRDVNVGVQGLQSLPDFIDRAAVCNSEHAILSTLSYKSRCAEQVCQEFLRHGLRDQVMKL